MCFPVPICFPWEHLICAIFAFFFLFYFSEMSVQWFLVGQIFGWRFVLVSKSCFLAFFGSWVNPFTWSLVLWLIDLTVSCVCVCFLLWAGWGRTSLEWTSDRPYCHSKGVILWGASPSWVELPLPSLSLPAFPFPALLASPFSLSPLLQGHRVALPQNSCCFPLQP